MSDRLKESDRDRVALEVPEPPKSVVERQGKGKHQTLSLGALMTGECCSGDETDDPPGISKRQ